MRQLLLTRRWVVLTTVILLAQPAFAWLGWWQWGRGARTHDIQNVGYAFQWWSFGILAIGGWAKLLRDELRERSGKAPPPTPAEATPTQRARKRAMAVAVSQRSAPVPVVEELPDAELAAYNDYLAWLNANPRS